MKLVIITGPQAVGKMSVGMALAEKTGMRLFHNHMTIELAKDIYGDMTGDAWKLVSKLRADVFDSVCNSKMSGFVFTYVWAFNTEEDHNYINNLMKKFEEKNWEVYIVELEADVETRKARNKTELRLKHKPSKRDVEWSENDLVTTMEKYRLNSEEGEITHPNYLRINNSELSEKEVADMMIEYFKF